MTPQKIKLILLDLFKYLLFLTNISGSSYMIKKLHESRLIGLSKDCRNLDITKGLVNTFKASTKSSVEHILKMSKCVYELKIREDKGELNNYDISYFCFSVGIDKESSTFRKFKLMGERYDSFMKYMDKLPSS